MDSSLPVELLQKEAAFARRMARDLLFAEHLADDVVQQGWLAFLERPGSPRCAGTRR